jgi:hypothetical protein
MKTPKVRPRQKSFLALKCLQCGNSERFVETMAYESHLVDGNLNYLHLIEAEEDQYFCAECLERVEPTLNGDSG